MKKLEQVTADYLHGTRVALNARERRRELTPSEIVTSEGKLLL
jgi:hypothetical protein